jgi:hypothetical protein
MLLAGETPPNLVKYMRPEPLQDPKRFDSEADEHHRAMYFAMHVHADMRWLLDEVMRSSPIADEQNRRAAADLLSGGYRSEGINLSETTCQKTR